MLSLLLLATCRFDLHSLDLGMGEGGQRGERAAAAVIAVNDQYWTLIEVIEYVWGGGERTVVGFVSNQ